MNHPMWILMMIYLFNPIAKTFKGSFTTLVLITHYVIIMFGHYIKGVDQGKIVLMGRFFESLCHRTILHIGSPPWFTPPWIRIKHIQFDWFDWEPPLRHEPLTSEINGGRGHKTVKYVFYSVPESVACGNWCGTQNLNVAISRWNWPLKACFVFNRMIYSKIYYEQCWVKQVKYIAYRLCGGITIVLL